MIGGQSATATTPIPKPSSNTRHPYGRRCTRLRNNITSLSVKCTTEKTGCLIRKPAIREGHLFTLPSPLLSFIALSNWELSETKTSLIQRSRRAGDKTPRPFPFCKRRVHFSESLHQHHRPCPSGDLIAGLVEFLLDFHVAQHGIHVAIVGGGFDARDV